MGYKTILFERKGNIGFVTLNRPEVLNALNNEMVRELRALVDELRDDYNTRVVILKGAGRAFCSGADVKEARGYTMAEYHERIRLLDGTMLDIEKLPQVWIAAVRGYAVAGGLELAVISDIRIASEDAKFGAVEPRVSIPSVAMEIWRLIGLGKAKELLYTSELIDAREAERIGLVNRVTSAEKLDIAAMEMAEKLLRQPPLALRFTKTAIGMGTRLSEEIDAYIQYTSVMSSMTEDRREGLAAFAEKREPKFKGR